VTHHRHNRVTGAAEVRLELPDVADDEEHILVLVPRELNVRPGCDGGHQTLRLDTHEFGCSLPSVLVQCGAISLEREFHVQIVDSERSS
jgi:hypothetical protein